MSIGRRVGNPPSGDSVISPPEREDWKRIPEPSGDQAGEPETTDSMVSSWSMVRMSAVCAWSRVAVAAVRIAAAPRTRDAPRRAGPHARAGRPSETGAPGPEAGP